MSIDGFGFSEGGADRGIGSSEVSSEALEQYRENAAAAAAQAKKDQKQERKKKQQEDSLHKIIIQFLNTPKYSGFFILIAQLLKKNIPADFILAVLALIHKESLQAVNKKNIPIKKPPNQKSQFPLELAAPLQHWTTLVFSVSVAQPHKVLETIMNENWEIDKNIEQFMSLVIREFFTFKKNDVPFDNISSFSHQFLQNLIQSLENQIHNQIKIGEMKGG